MLFFFQQARRDSMAEDRSEDLSAGSESPQSLGGKARARSLSREARREIARKAAMARHARQETAGGLPKARSEGVLPIGDVNIDVYVLWDRRRLVSKRAMARALGLKSEGGNAFLK